MNIESLIKELEMLKGKDYNISYDLEPIIREYKNIGNDRKSRREIYYERTITITDREPAFVEEIKNY